MEEIIASGQAEVVQAARALLADPDFPDKARAGVEPRRCLRCLSCFSDELTYGQPYCAINPESGRELEMKYDIPARTGKKVLVVGGGVGGMQAALDCHRRGHDVILCEKSHRLGGVLRCEDGVDFKKNLTHYLDYQEDAVKSSGIDLRLGVEVTPEYAAEIEADVIIAALGTTPKKPPIPGIDGTNVMAAQDAYTTLDKVGQKVVIIGAGLVGTELGLHLTGKGRKVTVVEALDHISDGGNYLHIIGLNVEIRERGLEIRFSTNVKEITMSGVVCDDGLIEADTVINATGQSPQREQAIALGSCAPEFHMIGDCVEARSIKAATSEAFMLARNIGRY